MKLKLPALFLNSLVLKNSSSFTRRKLSSSSTTSSTSIQMMNARINALQDVIGTDAGNRGMKDLIVPGDLVQASHILGTLPAGGHVVVLSGFPCCVTQNPPTETDGPPGACAIAQAALALGHEVTLAVDDCNKLVFEAAAAHLLQQPKFSVQTYPSTLSPSQEEDFRKLSKSCKLLIACERAGPGKNGVCYTMRGIDMNAKGLIAPLHRLVQETDPLVPFLAIGDGGNELGMGKVISTIQEKIPKGDEIGCVIAADHLIAASVSNWGGYALAAGAALARSTTTQDVPGWLEKCLPSEQEEIDLLNRCVAAGCRDGVSGKMEATVDGMPLETSLQCLRDIRAVALGINEAS
jgi:hypothetical protein